MSIIKIQDVAYVRFSAPDLDAMESFLVDFGLTRAQRDDTHLYMKGTDGDAFVHVTERGEAGFAAVAFEAASMADLETLAAVEDATIENIKKPRWRQACSP